MAHQNMTWRPGNITYKNPFSSIHSHSCVLNPTSPHWYLPYTPNRRIPIPCTRTMLIVVLRGIANVPMRIRQYCRIMLVECTRMNSNGSWHTFQASTRQPDIHYIQVLPYNSRIQRPIKQGGFDIRGLLIKAADSNENCRHDVARSVLQVERIRKQRITGYSQCSRG